MELTGLRVLLVEDEALVSMLAEDYLAELGCQLVATAARLDEALEKARTVAVDVAVLDVNLAGQMSYPVAEVLRERGIPAVFATGYGTVGVPDGLRDIPVMAKPFREENLAHALRTVMAGRG